MTTVFVTLVAGAIALVSFMRIAAKRARQAEWLAPALRALGRAPDPAALATELAYRLEDALGATRVDWWRRDDDGAYRTRSDERIDGREAEAVDVMITTGGAWRRDAVSRALAGPDATRVLTAHGAELV